MDFIELPDGTLINSSAIFRVLPPESGNRVDYINGLHHTLSAEYAEVLRAALKKDAKPGSIRKKPAKSGQG